MNGFYLKSRWQKRDKILSTSWLWLHIASKKMTVLVLSNCTLETRILFWRWYIPASHSPLISALSRTWTNLDAVLKSVYSLLFVASLEYQKTRVWGWPENREQSEARTSLYRVCTVLDINITIATLSVCNTLTFFKMF